MTAPALAPRPELCAACREDPIDKLCEARSVSCVDRVEAYNTGRRALATEVLMLMEPLLATQPGTLAAAAALARVARQIGELCTHALPTAPEKG